MQRIILISLIIIPLLLSCGGNGENNGGGNNHNGTDLTDWSLPSPLVSKVEIRSNGTLIETYEYTYDDKARIKTLVHTDCLQKEKLLDLEYSYDESGEMKAGGIYYPISTRRIITAVPDKGKNSISYKGSWAGAWTYVTGFDAGGTVTESVSDIDFAANNGQYSSITRYKESYTVSNGCISKAVMGSEISSQSQRTTKLYSDSAYTYEYSYSDRDDKQNFAAYVIPCTFPVWYAAGLPGCKKLITGINSGKGDAASKATSKIEYTFTPEGNIDTAIRTDYNAGESILIRTYKFTYQ